MRGDWHRYTIRQECAVCGHKGWCMYQGDITTPTAVLCARQPEGCATTKEGRPIEARNGMGWIHRLKDNPRFIKRPVRREPPPPPPAWMGEMADECCRRSLETLPDLADQLGVSVRSLTVLRVGWSDSERAWTFPMRNRRRDVLGIRLRDVKGRKWAVTGSTNALFLPQGFPGGKRLHIVEGPTDTAAMLDFGFDTIGRPSNTAGFDYLSEYVRLSGGKWKEICIIKNNDPIGSDARRLTDGAANILAMHLTHSGRSVRLIAPPVGKDVREWKNVYGATKADVETFIRRSPIIKLRDAA